MQPVVQVGTDVLEDAVRYPNDDAWIEGPDGVSLVGGRCAQCGTAVFPRPVVCPQCMSREVGQHVFPRQGRVYAYTTVHPPRAGYASPYTIGYVDLPGDVRVFTQLRHGATGLAIDAEAEVGVDVIRTEPDGRPVISYVFTVKG